MIEFIFMILLFALAVYGIVAFGTYRYNKGVKTNLDESWNSKEFEEPNV